MYLITQALKAKSKSGRALASRLVPLGFTPEHIKCLAEVLAWVRRKDEEDGSRYARTAFMPCQSYCLDGSCP